MKSWLNWSKIWKFKNFFFFIECLAIEFRVKVFMEEIWITLIDSLDIFFFFESVVSKKVLLLMIGLLLDVKLLRQSIKVLRCFLLSEHIKKYNLFCRNCCWTEYSSRFLHLRSPSIVSILPSLYVILGTVAIVVFYLKLKEGLPEIIIFGRIFAFN